LPFTKAAVLAGAVGVGSGSLTVGVATGSTLDWVAVGDAIVALGSGVFMVVAMLAGVLDGVVLGVEGAFFPQDTTSGINSSTVMQRW